MEGFVKVTANKCSADGHTVILGDFNLDLNVDLIGAFNGDVVLLKGGDTIRLGLDCYKNFTKDKSRSNAL